MTNGAQLVRYDAMVNAIAACHSVDEVTEIHDKALALELYAKQAMNVEAEREATEIRLRAERRAGQMLAALNKEPGKRTDKLPATVAAGSEYRETLDRVGINERTGRRWQELAGVAAPTFEQHLNGDAKPTTNAILRAANGSTSPMDSGSLWLWGTLRDWERDGHLDRGQAELFGGMTESMQADVRRVAPRVIDWLIDLLRGSR